jgi:hypothetical protein
MADRFCGNCGNELRPQDKFCPGCGKPVHETAVVPTTEADIPVPPLPRQSEESTLVSAEQAEPPPESRPFNIIEAFRQAGTPVKIVLGIAVLAGLSTIFTQSDPALGIILMLVLLVVAFFMWVAPDNGTRGAVGQAIVNDTEVEHAEPISEAERTHLLDEAIGGYLLRGFFVRLRTPTTAQLVMPKKFSFIWALLWFLLFGIGIIVYLIYYAAKGDEGVYLQVDEYGNVTATWQLR